MYQKCQSQRFQQIQRTITDAPIPKAIEHAFFATPRPLFLNRYTTDQGKSWQQVTANNLSDHLPIHG